MKILIISDCEPKVDHIIKTLISLTYKREDIECVRCMTHAKERTKDKLYDAIIIDSAFPVSIDSDVLDTAGLEFIKYMTDVNSQQMFITCCSTKMNITKDKYPNIIRSIFYDPFANLSYELAESLRAVRTRIEDDFAKPILQKDFEGSFTYGDNPEPFFKVILTQDPATMQWTCKSDFDIISFNRVIDKLIKKNKDNIFISSYIRIIPTLVNFKTAVFDVKGYEDANVVNDILSGNGDLIKSVIDNWMSGLAKMCVWNYRKSL